jgi:hypothetical protein
VESKARATLISAGPCATFSRFPYENREKQPMSDRLDVKT